jgi:hypothetical protein
MVGDSYKWTFARDIFKVTFGEAVFEIEKGEKGIYKEERVSVVEIGI